MQHIMKAVYGIELLWSRLFFYLYIFKILVINILQMLLTEIVWEKQEIFLFDMVIVFCLDAC